MSEEDQIGVFRDNAEYEAFTEKFKPKKTTDDCYTPPIVYDAVANWVAREYKIDRSAFVRPFFPGGDYENFDYFRGCVVVDNPPFSILTEIKKFYADRGILFFLFAPKLTLFSGFSDGITLIPAGVTITYENGACVATSFVTNLDKYQVRTAPTLYKAVESANNENLKSKKAELPKYSYPNEIITSSMVARWCKYGVDFKIMPEDCQKISALDAQKDAGKAVFGSAFLLSERAAAERAVAERAAAVVWELSERERGIVDKLSGKSRKSKEEKTAQINLFVPEQGAQCEA